MSLLKPCKSSSDALLLMLPGVLRSEHGQPGSREASGCMVR